jgi:hypothetical protein
MYKYAIEPIPVLDLPNMSWLTDIHLTYLSRRYKMEAGTCSKCRSDKVLQLYTEELVAPWFHNTEVLHGSIKGRCANHLLTDGILEKIEMPTYTIPANGRVTENVAAAIRSAMNSMYGSYSVRNPFDPEIGDKIIFDYTKIEWDEC